MRILPFAVRPGGAGGVWRLLAGSFGGAGGFCLLAGLMLVLGEPWPATSACACRHGPVHEPRGHRDAERTEINTTPTANEPRHHGHSLHGLCARCVDARDRADQARKALPEADAAAEPLCCGCRRATG